MAEVAQSHTIIHLLVDIQAVVVVAITHLVVVVDLQAVVVDLQVAVVADVRISSTPYLSFLSYLIMTETYRGEILKFGEDVIFFCII